MKLLVCGGRDFNDRNILFLTLEAASLYGGFDQIICGYNPKSRKFQGADQLAYEWAMQADFPCTCFPADWDRYGRSAGPRRNTEMADDKPDECLAFPRANGTWGNGTLNMIGQCAARGIKVTQMRPEDLTPTQKEGS